MKSPELLTRSVLRPGQHYGGRAIPLSLFATSVPTMTGVAAMLRPVVGQTGLSGTLRLHPDLDA
jgi:hypothetical protein